MQKHFVNHVCKLLTSIVQVWLRFGLLLFLLSGQVMVLDRIDQVITSASKFLNFDLLTV